MVKKKVQKTVNFASRSPPLLAGSLLNQYNVKFRDSCTKIQPHMSATQLYKYAYLLNKFEYV